MEADDEEPWLAAPSPESWLEAVVVPGPPHNSNALGQIWDCVESTGARLPGEWHESAAGAFAAARKGDWCICSYLMARCLATVDGPAKGLDALASPNRHARDVLWLLVVDPIVVEVPPCQERLWVWRDDRKADGEGPEWIPVNRVKYVNSSKKDRVCVEAGEVQLGNRLKAGSLAQHPGLRGSAEHFSVGEALDLSQLRWLMPQVRRLCLGDEERLELCNFVAAPDSSDRIVTVPMFLSKGVRHVPIRGGKFYVLAYPLAGDFTKALLRPAARLWTEHQRSVAADMFLLCGDSLVSLCVKGRQWSLAARMLRKGVPCPDLRMEFADLCGRSPVVQKQWMRDLFSATGGCSGRSLLELAAEAGCGSGGFGAILDALKESGQLPDLNVRLGERPPLIAAAANRGRWDIIRVLLELGGEVSVSPLIDLPAMAEAPREYREMAQVLLACGTRAATLREYFERSLSGEAMGEEMVPHGLRARRGVLEGRGGFRIFDRAAKLGGTQLGLGAIMAFVVISGSELQQLLAAEDGDEEILSCAIDLGGACTRRCLLQEDEDLARALDRNRRHEEREIEESGCEEKDENADLDGQSAWLAVLCPPGCVWADSDRRLVFHVPSNCSSTATALQANVCVSVSTPCCGKRLEGALVHVDGRRGGVTGSDGMLRLALPPGRHSLTSPDHSEHMTWVEVEPGRARMESVELRSSGGLFFFLQDGLEKTALKLTTNRYTFPIDAQPFDGVASWRVGSADAPRAADAPAGVYIVDNSKFRASTPGLAYHRKPSFVDVVASEYASWGSIVKGVPQCRNWVLVGTRFLPMQVDGVPVLLQLAPLCVEEGVCCGERLSLLEVTPALPDNVCYEDNINEVIEFFTRFKDECVVAMLHREQLPITVGYVLGMTPPGGAAVVDAQALVSLPAADCSSLPGGAAPRPPRAAASTVAAPRGLTTSPSDAMVQKLRVASHGDRRGCGHRGGASGCGCLTLARHVGARDSDDAAAMSVRVLGVSEQFRKTVDDRLLRADKRLQCVEESQDLLENHLLRRLEGLLDGSQPRLSRRPASRGRRCGSTPAARMRTIDVRCR